MVTIPASHRDIFDKRSFAHVATTDADGAPQVTPVWVGYDGTHVLINSALGRKKDRNLRERPRVAISVLDPDDPYRYVGLQGRVVEITEEGAEDLIHAFSYKYRGRAYDLPAGQRRVTYKIAPESVWTMG